MATRATATYDSLKASLSREVEMQAQITELIALSAQRDVEIRSLLLECGYVKGTAIGALESLRREHLPKCKNMFGICVCGADAANTIIERALAQINNAKAAVAEIISNQQEAE